MIHPRRTHYLLYSTLPLLLVLLVAPVWSQSVVRGTVLEEGTNHPINTVELRLVDAEGEVRAQTLSNEQGHFRLEVADSGEYSLAVRRVGYSPISAAGIEVGLAMEVEIEVRLSPRAVALQPVTVIATRRAEPIRISQFRERAELNRRMGRGRIYMRDDLDRLRPNSVREILDGVVWGNRCRPTILLDGLPADERMYLSADQLEGVELYRGVTQIPPEYYRYGMCGLALVWSRTDPEGMKPLTWGRVAAAGALVVLIGILSR